MAEPAALTIEAWLAKLREMRQQLRESGQVLYPLALGVVHKMDDLILELERSKPCVLCKGPVAKRLVPAKATLDYDKPPA